MKHQPDISTLRGVVKRCAPVTGKHTGFELTGNAVLDLQAWEDPECDYEFWDWEYDRKWMEEEFGYMEHYRRHHKYEPSALDFYNHRMKERFEWEPCDLE